MQELKVGDRVYRNGKKTKVTYIRPLFGILLYHTAGDGRLNFRSDLKPIIRLTPLVRAKMLLTSMLGHYSRQGKNLDTCDEMDLAPHQWQDLCAYNVVKNAVALITFIGGEEAAHLYDPCDGYVNGLFIRGDDVRQALRILGGI